MTIYIVVYTCTIISFSNQQAWLESLDPISTTKKSFYSSIFFPAFLYTAVIDKSVLTLFENAGIGNPITAAQNQRCNRRPIVAFFKNASIGSSKTLG